MSIQSALRVADVLDGIGVNTHIDYTDGQYANIAQDLNDLQYIGLTNLRDAAPDPSLAGQANLAAAAQAGMKFDFIVNGATNPVDAVAQIHAFVVAHPGSVTGIEGPNEVNNFPVTYHGLTGIAAAQAYQQDLYAAVNADPVLKDIPVLSFTDFPAPKTASDSDNVHLYNMSGGQPRGDITGAEAAISAIDPGKPVAITEIGYHTSIAAGSAIGWEGVDENTQAKLILNTVLDAVQSGSASTYIYQLLDAYSDPTNSDIQDHFGLFNLDNTPKQAATALHNLTTILSDPGSNAAGFSAGGLDYSLSGMPSSAYSLLTQKSDSSYQIVLWNEPDVWNEQTHQPISVPSSAVTVQLGHVFASVQIFDPLAGSTPVQTLNNVSSVALALADHPFIIQVSGPAASSTPSTSTPSTGTPTTSAPTTSAPSTGGAGVATTVGTGPDQLVLKISEDAYKGDAQYTISVDGQQVGGTLTAHAAHVAGSSALDDTVTVQGNFGAGPHTVSVNFLNDAYYGPGSDRNLYVDGASHDGTAIANSSLSLLSAGPQQFTVPGTGADTSAPGTSTSAPTTSAPTTSAPSTSAPSTGGAGVATTVGTGPDQLVLKISEDAYKGDAQYTISVDGQQVGGTLTAHAAHVAGSSALDDTVTVQGNFGAGPHTVSVNFLNDAYYGPGSDRNLYVDGASHDGTAIANSSLSLLSAGPQQFTVPGSGADTSAPSTSTSAPTTSAPTTSAPSTSAPSTGGGGVATTVGTGPDQLVLKISEDAYKGDAQYTISVDGQQVGGTLTAHAAHVAGSSALDDTVTVQGNFGAGPHTVSVNFLNDAYYGPGSDRNLYVDGASHDGTAIANSSLSLLSAGPQQFTVPGSGADTSAPSTSTSAPTTSAPTTSAPSTSAPSTGGGGVATTVGTGPDQLVLKISEDAYKGDAQYTIAVDGQQVGGTLTAHAAHVAGSSALDDTVTVQGNFGAGPHTVSVAFLNDTYGGPGNDRNLYVDGASHDGTAIANSSLSLLNTGSQQFTVPATSTGSGASATATGAGTAAAAPAAPTVALTHDTGTGGTHVTSDGLVTYAPSVSGDTLHYKLDSGTFTTTAPVLATDGSADGPHTVTVYETNAAGLASADASLIFTLDTHHAGSGFHMA